MKRFLRDALRGLDDTYSPTAGTKRQMADVRGDCRNGGRRGG